MITTKSLVTTISTLVLASVCVSVLGASAPDGRLEPTRLQCEYLVDPLGIDVATPRLSWALTISEAATHRGQRQTAYQVLVASSRSRLAENAGDLWDSGRVKSDATFGVEYAGKPLASRCRCYWKVRVWDRDGKASAWSPEAFWETALLDPSDWEARWINDGRATPDQVGDFFRDDPAPLFRKEFPIDKPVRSARLYVTGLGYYAARLNGADVGDRLLDPGWTDYEKRVFYSTYDVTSRIVQGRNCLGLVAGNGWYNPLPMKMFGRFNLRNYLTVGRPRVLAQLEIELADGTRQIIATDDTWKTAPGPILRNNIYLGEVYDARRELPGWDRPGLKDAAWTPAKFALESVGLLQAQPQPPIVATGKLKPVRRTEPSPGVFVFDMGQNFAGLARLRVRGPAGAVVTLRFGELLNADGTVNVMTGVCGQIKHGKENIDGEPPRLACQSDTYILSGQGDESYLPRFTWHGFRYVQVNGYPGTPPLDAIEGLRLSADVGKAGQFSCSNQRFNNIEKMVHWTFLSNLFSVQSDCPARERFGYGGDPTPTCEAFLFLFDMAPFYEKVVRDFGDAARSNGGITETAPFVGIASEGLGGQSGPIGWQTTYPLLLEKLYQYCGDVRIVREQYPTVRRQVEFLRSQAKDFIIDRCLGDHESLDPKAIPLTATAFFYQDAAIAARLAKIAGKRDDAAEYRRLAEQIRQAFIAKFFDAQTGRFDLGTQACQAFALHFDLLPPEQRQAVVDVLLDEVRRHEGHLATGIFGTRYLMETLSRSGHAQTAFEIAQQDTFPGWGYMLARGATTLWEHWQYDDNVYSHNHPMFGSVSTWFFEDLGGIRADPNAFGFDRITIQPQVVGDLTEAKVRYESIRGAVACDWQIQDRRLRMNVTVPPGVTATVFVPTTDPSSVVESGRPASQSPGVEGLAAPEGAVYRVSGGRYRFESEWSPPASSVESSP
ncbi:MAG: family 78 glycoside hydrolase catalytic domain [Thermoguttaceae bacterium]